MTGGGAIWSIAAATAAGIAAQAASAAVIDQSLSNTSDGPYRPAQWQNAPLVTVTVPGTAGDPSGKVGSGITPSSQGIVLDDGTTVTPSFVDNSNLHPGSQGTPDQVYVFDAVIRTEHQQRIEKTQHPIQTGANVSDHAFIMPARVVLEIGMSDAMDSFTPGQWTGDSSKSVNTYQTLKSIAAARQPLTVTTRLNVYTNMLLTDISAPDTADTRFALRASVVFEELLTGTVTSQQVSGRSDLTGSTNLGTKQPLPVSGDISRFTHSTLTTVPDAGVLSSNGS